MRTEILAIVAIVVAALCRALREDLPAFHSIAPKWRALLTAALGIVSGAVDLVVAGSDWQTSAMTVLKTALPSFVLLLVEAVLGGGDGGGSLSKVGSPTKIKSDAPAGPYSAKLVKGPWSRAWLGGMAIALACVGAIGCVSQIPQWIQQAIVMEQNIAAIVAALRSAADFVFVVSPPSDAVRKTVADAFTDVSLAEAAIAELLNAGDAATQEQLDAAYAHLKNAYANLTKLLGELGVVQEVASGSLKAKRGDGVVVLVPLALKVRIVK